VYSNRALGQKISCGFYAYLSNITSRTDFRFDGELVPVVRIICDVSSVILKKEEKREKKGSEGGRERGGYRRKGEREEGCKRKGERRTGGLRSIWTVNLPQ
jgi:hypothetical protein